MHALILLITAPSAWAVADDYAGAYDFTCADRAVVVSYDVQSTDAQGQLLADDALWSLPVPCEGQPARDIVGWARDARHSCAATAMSGAVCRDLIANLLHFARPHTGDSSWFAPIAGDLTIDHANSPQAAWGNYSTDWWFHRSAMPDLPATGELVVSPTPGQTYALWDVPTTLALQDTAACHATHSLFLSGSIQLSTQTFDPYVMMSSNVECHATTVDTGEAWSAAFWVSDSVLMTGLHFP